MQHWLRRSALCYAAGAIGELAKGGLIWACTRTAMTATFADQLAGAMQSRGIYARLVWGGLYAMIFLLPFARSSVVLRGLLGGLAISVLQLLIVPLLQHGSLHIFALSTLSLLVLNSVWGLVAAGTLHLTE